MLIVGLGNPGSEYASTRHNIGFMVIDELISKFSARDVTSSSFLGECYKFQNHFLLKPQTYMNLSGNSVIKVKNFYKAEKVVVIHDDLDLPFGTLRFKLGGGHGGHNGLKSIDANIGKEYIRIRMGIGKPEHKGEVASYVLSEFSELQKNHLEAFISDTVESVLFLLDNSMEDTSSKFTKKKSPLIES